MYGSVRGAISDGRPYRDNYAVVVAKSPSRKSGSPRLWGSARIRCRAAERRHRQRPGSGRGARIRSHPE